MNICPHCGNDLLLPDNTLTNMESYMKPVVSVTTCCGALVNLIPSLTFRVSELHNSTRMEDDWGRKPSVT